jgi:transposase
MRGPAAAAVATARKLAVMIWHALSRDAEYTFARPAFIAMKFRKVALKAGTPREYRKAGPGRDYWNREIRHKEMDYFERAERAHERMVEAWWEKPGKTAAE